MNRIETAKILSVIRVLFPQSKQPAPADEATQLELWTDLLSDLDYAAVNQAVRAHATSEGGNWAPSIAQIRTAATNLRLGSVRAGGDAWRDFLDEVGRVGSYRTPAFKDPVVDRVVRALGWKELCLSENQVADRARFIELYDRLAVDRRQLEQSPQLQAAADQRGLNAAQQAVRDVALILTRNREPAGE